MQISLLAVLGVFALATECSAAPFPPTASTNPSPQLTASFTGTLPPNPDIPATASKTALISWAQETERP